MKDFIFPESAWCPSPQCVWEPGVYFPDLPPPAGMQAPWGHEFFLVLNHCCSPSPQQISGTLSMLHKRFLKGTDILLTCSLLSNISPSYNPQLAPTSTRSHLFTPLNSPKNIAQASSNRTFAMLHHFSLTTFAAATWINDEHTCLRVCVSPSFSSQP